MEVLGIDLNSKNIDKYISEGEARQPRYGSEEYFQQVRTVKMRLDENTEEIKTNKKLKAQILMLYVLDMSFHRAAISQAIKEWEKENDR